MVRSLNPSCHCNPLQNWNVNPNLNSPELTVKMIAWDFSYECLRAIHSPTRWDVAACGWRVVARRSGILLFAGRAVAQGGFSDHFGECAGTGSRSADGSLVTGCAA